MATRAQAQLPERLLTPADLEQAGMKGAVRPAAELNSPQGGLHSVRGMDWALVLTIAAPGGGGSIGEATLDGVDPSW